jgi:Ankyrin repeats (3 copies)
MTTLSSSLPLSASDRGWIVPHPLYDAIDHFISELSSKNYDRSCELLKKALRVAGNNPGHIAEIRKAFDAYNVNNNILRELITNNHMPLAHLLIDLRIAEMFLENKETPLQHAVDQGNHELMSHLLKFVNPDAYNVAGTALYKAVEKADRESVKLLLAAGADPNLGSLFRSTPFEYAVIFNDISLIKLFFDSTCHFPVNVTSALEKLSLAIQFKFESDNAKKQVKGSALTAVTKGKLDKDYEEEHRDTQRRLARLLPPLVDTIPCYAPYVARRDKAVNYFLKPLLSPPPSIREDILPLMEFISHEMRHHPDFTITISKEKDDCGEYDPTTGNIELYIPETAQPFKDLPDTQDTTLLHELCHKIFEKTPQNKSKLEEAVEQDKRALEAGGWKNCHPVVKELLSDVTTRYSKEKVNEEFLVRTIEILYIIANKHPTYALANIGKIFKRDLLSTFCYFTYIFIPNLCEYNYEMREQLLDTVQETTVLPRKVCEIIADY